MTMSTTHLVLLPTYNTGPRLCAVVTEALQHWQPILVVVDGSTDGSERAVLALAQTEPDLTVLVLPCNSGKGAAVLAGARAARERGFTHALVMDADGQHPAASIAEFMAASRHQPEAMVLGRPVFPPNIPAARLHGRKLSVWLVHFELFGAAIADPLFGFRIYPLAPLLAVLGPCRGGRRYDFDTESSVRLCWAGVPARNLAAPVKYFSRAEGGVSHFRYVRDNVTQVWLHLRLITELLLWRWPAVLRYQRQWRLAAAALGLVLAGSGLARAAEPTHPLVQPAYRLAPGAPAWGDLREAATRRSDTTAEFTEHRHFPFRRKPVVLNGEVRVSARRGLSLHYLAPEEHTVILDEQGLLLRGAAGEKTPPADPRAAASNEALRHIVRFDLAALEQSFELYGQHDGLNWTLVLVARTAELRRGIGVIAVAGEGATVRRIELRHSARMHIEILNAPPRPAAPFTPEELKRFFR